MPPRRTKNQRDLASFGELRLIERIRGRLRPPTSDVTQLSVVEGIGDDAAVLKWGRGADLLLLTCDTLVEDVHFRRGTPLYGVGWKAMGCNLSDIAAMGGVPQYAAVSLACPASATVNDVDEMYAGMTELGKQFDVVIVGGDTVESPRGLTVTVTVVGKVEEKTYVSRSGAKPGDAICVTGTLGGSLLGKHLAFTPRVKEGRFLARRFSPTAMIDISDGLASDLARVMEASGTTAEVFAKSVPVSEAAKDSAAREKVSPILMALHDGEDFELLFTLPRENVERCLAVFRKNFATPVTVIGRVKRGRRVSTLVEEDATTAPLRPAGYEHFRKRPSGRTDAER